MVRRACVIILLPLCKIGFIDKRNPGVMMAITDVYQATLCTQQHLPLSFSFNASIISLRIVLSN